MWTTPERYDADFVRRRDLVMNVDVVHVAAVITAAAGLIVANVDPADGLA